jgi:hypothetical protein
MTRECNHKRRRRSNYDKKQQLNGIKPTLVVFSSCGCSPCLDNTWPNCRMCDEYRIGKDFDENSWYSRDTTPEFGWTDQVKPLAISGRYSDWVPPKYESGAFTARPTWTVHFSVTSRFYQNAFSAVPRRSAATLGQTRWSISARCPLFYESGHYFWPILDMLVHGRWQDTSPEGGARLFAYKLTLSPLLLFLNNRPAVIWLGHISYIFFFFSADFFPENQREGKQIPGLSPPYGC